MNQDDMTTRGHPAETEVMRQTEGLMPTFRVVVVCPRPSHEFTVTVEPDSGDLAGQACEIVFALLNIGHFGADDLPELGRAPQVEAVRAWYADHDDLRPGVTLQVTGGDGVALLSDLRLDRLRPPGGPLTPAAAIGTARCDVEAAE